MLLPIVALVLAVLCAYMQALGGSLVWDDRLLILDAQLVQHGAPLREYLSRPLWSGDGTEHVSLAYYRPLVTLSFAIDQQVHGSNTAGFHLTNLVVHVWTAVALLVVLKKHGARPWVAAGLAAAWALLPRLAEAAAWISGRADAMAGALSLTALALWGPSRVARAVAAGLLGLAMLAKESALAAVVALMVMTWVEMRDMERDARLRAMLERVAPLLLVVLAYGAARFSLVGLEVQAKSLGAVGRARTVLEAVWTYTLMVLDPLRPRAVIGRVGAVTSIGTAGGLLVIAAVVAAIVRFRSRIGAREAVGLGLVVCGLLPVVHLVPIPLRTLTADRFLYLPAAGLALLLVSPVERLLAAKPRAGIFGAVVIAALFVATFRRVGVWSNETDFWVETYLTTPRTNNAGATELAGVYFRGGRYREALELSSRALGYDDPNREDPQHNMAVCLSRLGRREEALASLLASTRGRLSPEDARLVAVFQLQGGEVDAAQKSLERLATDGDPGAKALLVRVPILRTAHDELGRLGSTGDPERRARLATLLSDHVRAVPAWLEAARAPTSTKAGLLEGLSYLVQTGERDAIETMARAYQARFGPLDSAFSGMVEVRVAEIDYLLAVAPLVGLAQGRAASAGSTTGG